MSNAKVLNKDFACSGVVVILNLIDSKNLACTCTFTDYFPCVSLANKHKNEHTHRQRQVLDNLLIMEAGDNK